MDIFDELSKQPSSEKKQDVFDEIANEPSKIRSVLSALPKGLIKGAHQLAKMFGPTSLGPIPSSVEEKILDKFLPTRKEQAEQFLERAGEIAPMAAIGPEGLAVKAAQTGLGALAGHLAEKGGLGSLGQGISEAVGMGIPGLAKSTAGKITGAFSKEIERLPSGLMKPKAIESARPQLGRITKKMQTKLIEKLDQESSKLTKASVEKNLPISKKIEEGFDFDTHFRKGFTDLEKVASKANPEIDLTPVSQFLAENRQKYRGIPNLHPQGKKVMQEVKALSNNPQTSLNRLYKIYRSNNQKMHDIYERSFVEGKQKEYVKFLQDLNKSIVKAFEQTLPADSVWMKQFKDLNREYGAVQKGNKVLNDLKPILGNKIKSSAIESIINNPKTQKKLELSLGKEGANEVIQISKDLKTAREAVKKIPAKYFKKWDAEWPLAAILLFPGLKIPLGIKVGYDSARRLFGWYLTTPARKKAYDEALKAISNNDFSAYSKAALILRNEFSSEENED